MLIENVFYCVNVCVIGGCDGCVIIDDGWFEVWLIMFVELGGVGGEGINLEQLFVVGYSVCFFGVMKFVGVWDKICVLVDVFVQGSVGIGVILNGFGIEVDLKISLFGMDCVEV